MGKKGFPWRHPKKYDAEARSSVAKKEAKLRNRVPVLRRRCLGHVQQQDTM
jgi:hypothetical protein